MSAAVVAAVVARIRSAGLNVFEVHPRSSAGYPYVVLVADAGPRTSDRAVDARRVMTLTWQTTVVGERADQVRAAVDAVTTTLNGWSPEVDGRVCHKVAHLSSQPSRRDNDLPDRVVIYATDQWSVVSSPISA